MAKSEATQTDFEGYIENIVKQAMANGVIWTDKQFAAIKDEAVAEVSVEMTHKIFGGRS